MSPLRLYIVLKYCRIGLCFGAHFVVSPGVTLADFCSVTKGNVPAFASEQIIVNISNGSKRLPIKIYRKFILVSLN